MIADSSFAAEPEVRGPMAADGNSERLNGRVSTVLTAGKLSVTFRFVVSIPRRIKHLGKPKLTHHIGQETF